ncbi:MAG: hypothetical protein MZU97_02380 [Bacillus subtilis]|nr:hypothetical protein [Bacillus subtilis]
MKSPFVSYYIPNGSDISPLNVPGRDKIVAFMVRFTSNSAIRVRLFNWWGEDLLPPGVMINLSTGYLMFKSPYYNSGDWTDSTIPYVWILTAAGV